MDIGRQIAVSSSYSLFVGSDSGFPLAVVIESVFNNYIDIRKTVSPCHNKIY